jgi:RNA polymerase sporulation-specific sigma factor
LRRQIDAALSPLERNVLVLYLEGMDYLQIAQRLDRKPKSIDNALQRIRAKVEKLRH